MIVCYFIIWVDLFENNCVFGEMCMCGCANLVSGMYWRDVGVVRLKGCGLVMCVVLIGVLYYGDCDILFEVVCVSSVMTYGYDVVIEVFVVGVLMVVMAVDGVEFEEIYEAIMDECASWSAEFLACMQKVLGLLDALSELVFLSVGLGESWVGDEVFVLVLYCFWCHKDDYVVGVLEAINTDGDSDSIGCIAGSAFGV